MNTSPNSKTSNKSRSVHSNKLLKIKDLVSNIKELQPDHESRKILLSRLPSTRQQNPERYDNIVNFWSRTIRKLIEDSNLLIFTPQQLKEIFTIDGGIVPISLMSIIDEIERNNEIELFSRFTTQMGWTSWLWNRVAIPTLQWSIAKVYSPSTSSPRKTDSDKAALERKLVCPVVVNIKAEELYQIQLDEIKSSIIDNIISITNLEKSVSDWFVTKEELYLLLHILDKQGKAKLIVHNNETKGVKFANEGEKVALLETDIGILELKNTYEKLLVLEESLKKDIEACSEKIKTYIRAKQRDLSLHQLKRKKSLEAILANRHQSSNNIHEVLSNIESAHSNQQVMDTLCIGVSTLKKFNEKMSVDQVNTIMDNFADVMLDHKEIEEAVQAGMVSNAPESNPEEDAELEKELERMEEEQKKKQLEATKPTVTTPPPVTTTTTTQPVAVQKSLEDLELEAELEKLSLEDLGIKIQSSSGKKKEPLMELS